MFWIIGGVIVYILACLLVAGICGSRRRYPEPTPVEPRELRPVYDSREGGWL